MNFELTYKEMTLKPWYQSKTVWIAVMQGLIGVYAAFISVNPAVQTVASLAVLKSALDIVLRMLTTQPIQ